MRLFRIHDNDEFVEYEEQDFRAEYTEYILESWLENNPDSIVEDGKLLIIGRQVPTNLGSVIDLLAIDREGDVAVVELKRDRTPRDTLAQVLEYASFAKDLDHEQLEQILLAYTGDEGITLSEYHRDFFELGEDEAVSFNKNQRLVIIGQDVTPQIRQTATFLRQKGLRVTCIEFKYFQIESGERLLSTDIVVGKEPVGSKTVVTERRSLTDRATFLLECDDNKRPVYEAILELSDRLGLPIHWGVTGFSLNVDISGRHVALCYGWPRSAHKGQLHTAFKQIDRYVAGAPELLEAFRVRFRQAGFTPVGSKGEMKHPLERKLTAEQITALTSLFVELAQQAKNNGLRESS